jgi:hypothetical protein
MRLKEKKGGRKRETKHKRQKAAKRRTELVKRIKERRKERLDIEE